MQEQNAQALRVQEQDRVKLAGTVQEQIAQASRVKEQVEQTFRVSMVLNRSTGHGQVGSHDECIQRLSLVSRNTGSFKG